LSVSLCVSFVRRFNEGAAEEGDPAKVGGRVGASSSEGGGTETPPLMT
jgi:hypothetical protein